jgi:hypothetical protein
MTIYQEKEYFKGLGFYPDINKLFLKQLEASLERMEK